MLYMHCSTVYQCYSIRALVCNMSYSNYAHIVDVSAIGTIERYIRHGDRLRVRVRRQSMHAQFGARTTAH